MKDQVTEHTEETQSITEFFSVSLCAISESLCLLSYFVSTLLGSLYPSISSRKASTSSRHLSAQALLRADCGS